LEGVRVSVGTLTIAGGVGEARFALNASYDKRPIPTPGKPIGIAVNGANFSLAGGFVVDEARSAEAGWASQETSLMTVKTVFLLVALGTLTGCGMGIFQPPPRPAPYVKVAPDAPKIGEAFTFIIDQSDDTTPLVALIPEGEYTVRLSTTTIQMPNNGDMPLPTAFGDTPVENDAVIGTIRVAGRKGQAQFTLQADYGNGIKPMPGKVVGLKFSNSQHTGGFGFYVGGN
jgi:hypothetical protein